MRCEPVTLCFTGPADAGSVVGFVEPGTLELLLAADSTPNQARQPADAALTADWATAVAATSTRGELLTVLTMWVATGTRD